MADSASESDSSSIDGGPIMMPPSPITREQMQKRIDSLQQQNRVLKVELETYKLKMKAMDEECKRLRETSVYIQVRAEQEEEFISNTLLKKIQALKKEKETLAHHYEQEEECLTNDLSRKLTQLRQEKCKLEQTLEQEQECLVNRLMRKIEKLEAETLTKQTTLEQLRREKVDLENTLEQEQEALVNKLWKRMDKLEAEKRQLQIKLDQPVSDPVLPRDQVGPNKGEMATNISAHLQHLRGEVTRLRHQLDVSKKENSKKMEKMAKEERQVREDNLRLQRKLQLEVERRTALCRHLSESESSLEMEEERQYNEMASNRCRTSSSPLPFPPSPCQSRPLSPGSTSGAPGVFRGEIGVLGYASMNRCYVCGQTVPPNLVIGAPSTPLCPTTQVINQSRNLSLGRSVSERFVKPIVPQSSNLNTSGGIPTGSQILSPNPPPPSTSPATVMDSAKY